MLQSSFFIILFLTGIIIVITAWILKVYPPKKINNLYGYRTKRSMKNQEVWDYAQIYSSQYLKWMGLLMMAISFLGPHIPVNDIFAAIAATVLCVVLCLVPVYFTEKELKRVFG